MHRRAMLDAMVRPDGIRTGAFGYSAETGEIDFGLRRRWAIICRSTPTRSYPAELARTGFQRPSFFPRVGTRGGRR